ncbi:hypothetical protein PO587_38685 [Streptomyces gilvifuscus]|uniref:Holin n=1 Tax=Streptomyces gilvifuscus TaxID=1550617 RepID=A0ABT5G6A5_9ACTN|nr:hypothetical protein [Streptomyces gilvifuscus]MDC2960369.1 hypothetical protein [Streptomyces gilvifuscus]
MKNEERESARWFTVKLPRVPIRWSAVSTGGIVTAISTGQVETPVAVAALIVLGVSANVCDVIAVAFAARGDTKP